MLTNVLTVFHVCIASKHALCIVPMARLWMLQSLLTIDMSVMQQYAVLGPGLLHQAVSRGLLSIAALFLDKGCDVTECQAPNDEDGRATSALLLLVDATQVTAVLILSITHSDSVQLPG